jgi:Platelet-activating factor acetylhydrolase, isoform II
MISSLGLAPFLVTCSKRRDSSYSCAIRRRPAALLIAILVWVVLAAPLRAAILSEPEAPLHDRITNFEVSIWLPGRGYPPPWPLIIFSHGFHGCATQSVFLTEALAADGYAVFAPNHRDFASAILAYGLVGPKSPSAGRAPGVRARMRTARMISSTCSQRCARALNSVPRLTGIASASQAIRSAATR